MSNIANLNNQGDNGHAFLSQNLLNSSNKPRLLFQPIYIGSTTRIETLNIFHQLTLPPMQSKHFS